MCDRGPVASCPPEGSRSSIEDRRGHHDNHELEASASSSCLADLPPANRLHHVEDGAAALDFLFGRGQFAGRAVNTPPKVVLLDLKLPKVVLSLDQRGA